MSDDKELQAIRAKRMQELQGMQGNPEKQEEAMRQQQQAMNSILNQVLDQQARARLNTIMLAKPEKGKKIETMVLQMATSGQIGGKLSENDLIGLLERVSAQMQKTTTVKFDRRRAALDSDDDD
ncbi:programmed cell death 5 [Oratosquilla oratoria]|uniref:programmed cell death 5 n=1 Tax=Oratosquilla oratoria TaxID=337810 RepID=UPI003F76C2FE